MNYSKGDVVLLSYPFTDLKTVKVRPAVVIASNTGSYSDQFVVPLTSKVQNLSTGEFVLNYWAEAGLNVPSAIKRGCVLIDVNLIKLRVGRLSQKDIILLDKSLKLWFELE